LINLIRSHFWLGGNVDQDLLSGFPKGIRVWLGRMRDLKEIWSSTMRREKVRYMSFFSVQGISWRRRGPFIKVSEI
jgi:hypothetical protein